MCTELFIMSAQQTIEYRKAHIAVRSKRQIMFRQHIFLLVGVSEIWTF